MHQALYRKWRPQTFDDVYGQEHITSILKYETENNKFSHAYLFCGSRGTGKTTCAKILAKAVNCESPVGGSPCNCCPSCRAIDSGAATDVLEMDAASNNGVENIRDIRDEVVYTPTSLKYRVYIVDEVHMLSGSAFNALLKTLEEPPSHVVFILATTELHKLPATIISRCQRFDFRRIATEVLMARLSLIAEKEGIVADEGALRAIAKLAQGGMRDAISLLELCAGNRTAIDEALVETTVGSGGKDKIVKTVKAVCSSDYDTIFGVVDDIVRSSKDIGVFWQELMGYYRDMLVFKTTEKADRYLDLTDNEKQTLGETSALFTKETILTHCRMLDSSLYEMQRAGNAKRVIAEMTLIKMCDSSLDTGLDNILSRLSRLEVAISSGAVAATPPQTVKPREKEAAPEVKREETVTPEIKVTDPPKAAVATDGSLKPIRGWREIASRCVGNAGYVLPFLEGARAYFDGQGKVTVRFAGDFAVDMVKNAGVKPILASVLSAELHANLGENDVRFEVSEDMGDDGTAGDLDDLVVSEQ
ncbi:MAG: DNA polymerase III subunit gamma/tau [Ruminococcaceae bacterium]|nr:DNA polymerase III subunit gamma/tau [Oscillospiraceae bacterium]